MFHFLAWKNELWKVFRCPLPWKHLIRNRNIIFTPSPHDHAHRTIIIRLFLYRCHVSQYSINVMAPDSSRIPPCYRILNGFNHRPHWSHETFTSENTLEFFVSVSLHITGIQSFCHFLWWFWWVYLLSLMTCCRVKEL